VIDTIVGAPRGSLQLMNFVAQYFEITGENVQSITVNTRDGELQRSEVTFGQLPDVEKIVDKVVLWVDDVRDTGVTEDAACRILADLGAKLVLRADLGYKPANDKAEPKRKPDLFVFETDKWVVFPWERIIELRRAHDELTEQGATTKELTQLERNFMNAQGLVSDEYHDKQ
jgi:hypoxanthine phosphoribosyltransferase